MILEEKHINPYLPYQPIGYDVVNGNGILSESCIKITNDNIKNVLASDEVKIVLRPLSDLFNGDFEHILDEFSQYSLWKFENAFLTDLRPKNALDFINYTIAMLLFENHFDVFNLIPNGHAININNLRK